MTNIDAIVAGAGIWGCTVARRLAEAGRKVLVLEKRPVVGGNVRCEIDEETSIEIHKYGSHIFHTHISEVWEFVNRFVKFNGYQHKVLANYKGNIYFLPLGLALINKFFGVELKPGEVADFMADEAHSKAIFDAFFRGYTSKQWGKSPEEIDPSIIKRVPVRSNYDVNYFNDYNQGIPLTGYNSLFDRLLDHPNITVRCNAAVRLEDGVFKVDGDELPKVPIYYSGPIDALFCYKFGHLPWRTLRFETEKLSVKDNQGTSVVNYTEADVPYTRIHEFKHYHLEDSTVMNSPKTIIMREYSATWKPGDEPYYPIDNADSRELLSKYQAEAATISNLIVGGRLGGYKYYDMDKSIESAMKVEISVMLPNHRDTNQHHFEERVVFAGCGVRAVGTNESNAYRRTQRKNTVFRSANQYSRTQRRLECNGSAAVMRRRPQIWYNMRIGMDQKRHMLWQSDARVRYSAAYPTGRERIVKGLLYHMVLHSITLQQKEPRGYDLKYAPNFYRELQAMGLHRLQWRRK